MIYFKNLSYKLLLLLTLVVLVSCENDDIPNLDEEVEEVPLTAGSADFSNFVAVGNSLVAGYTDGALFILGQENSPSNMLAQKFALAGGGEFTQPLMNDNIGGLLIGGEPSPALPPRLYFDGTGPARIDQVPTTEATNIQPGPYNNMGVPGASSYHLLANGYGNIAGLQDGTANPYFVRMASNPNASIIDDATSQSPTFFLYWIGGNDVIGYSFAGGAGVDQTGNPDPTTYGASDLTDPGLFANAYSTGLSEMANTGAQGVAVNVPDVADLPHFTTIPYDPVPLDAPTAALINTAYEPYNAGLQQALAAGLISLEEADSRTISFNEGQNPVVLIDEYLTDLSALGLPSYRQSTENDLFPLASSTFIGTTVNNDPTLINGVTVPLEDEWVLSQDEIAEVEAATQAYNAAITQAAADNNIPLMDLNALVDEVSTSGIVFDEFQLNSSLVFGGVFSLDGIHATARGYALFANEILRLIDQTYGSNFEEAGALLKARDFTTFYPETLP